MPAGQQVGSPGKEPVEAVAAVQDVEHGVVEHRRGVQLRQAAGAAAQLVDPRVVRVAGGPLGQDLQQGRRVAVVNRRAADEQVVARSAQSSRSRPSPPIRMSRPTRPEQQVVAGPAQQDVVAAAAEEHIVAGPAVEDRRHRDLLIELEMRSLPARPLNWIVPTAASGEVADLLAAGADDDLLRLLAAASPRM